jgi:hypothetical protein
MKRKKFGKKAVLMAAVTVMVLAATAITAFATTNYYSYNVPLGSAVLYGTLADKDNMSFQTNPTSGQGGAYVNVRGYGGINKTKLFPFYTSVSPLRITIPSGGGLSYYTSAVYPNGYPITGVLCVKTYD